MSKDHGIVALESDDVEILERREAAQRGIPLFSAHWQIFVPSFVICVLYLVIWAILFTTGQTSDGTGRFFVVLMAIVTPFLAAWAFLRYQTIRLQVSDDHIYIQTGWPREIPMDIPKSLVESVAVERGVIGRVFGGGTLVLRISDGRVYRITDLAHPEEAEGAVRTFS